LFGSQSVLIGVLRMVGNLKHLRLGGDGDRHLSEGGGGNEDEQHS
jgi:hypothetical protein